MRRLEIVAPGRLEFREVAEPRIESDDQVIVRPAASTTCDRRPSVSPVLGEVLHAVAEGRFDPSPVFSDRLPFDDAAAALAELPRKAVFVR